MQQHQQERQQDALQLLPSLQVWHRRLWQIAYTATFRPFSDPCYCGPVFLQTALALLLSIALVPLGVALQLQGTPGFAGSSKAVTPWAGMLYIAAAVPVLRLLAAPVAAGLFRLGEVCGVVLLHRANFAGEMQCCADLCAEGNLYCRCWLQTGHDGHA
jgi:hypothetical protein